MRAAAASSLAARAGVGVEPRARGATSRRSPSTDARRRRLPDIQISSSSSRASHRRRRRRSGRDAAAAAAAAAAAPPPSPPSDSSSDALADALAAIVAAGTPFALGALPRASSSSSSSSSSMPPGVTIAPDVAYALEPGIAPDGDALFSCDGAKAYAAIARRFPRVEDDELFEASRRVTRASIVSPSEATVQWEVAFIPRKLKWVWEIGDAWVGVRVETYDVLDRMGELARFSWRGLWMLFYGAATTGVMRLPAARVKGNARLRFVEVDSGDDVSNPEAPTSANKTVALARHVETIELVGCVNTPGVVRNKRVARDLLEFLDARKPPNTSVETWEFRVEDSIRWRDVPGMGQFDVDGLEDEGDRAAVYGDVAALLAFGTVVALTFGVGIGGWYLRGLEHERMMAEMLATGAY